MDFSQLEFRTAVFLAQDKQGMKDIQNGVDVHQFTADTIGCSRQDEKPIHLSLYTEAYPEQKMKKDIIRHF